LALASWMTIQKVPAPHSDPIPVRLEVDAAYHIVTTPTDFALYRGGLLMGAFPTLADAQAAKKIAEAQ